MPEIKARLLRMLDEKLEYREKMGVIYDSCQHISTLEHKNQQMREFIEMIVFAHKFIESFGENEGYLWDEYREKLKKGLEVIK